MNAFLGAVREVWGLFVEDETFTLGMIACLIAASYLLPRLPIAPAWRGPLFFGLLALVLVENVVRSARR